MDESKSMFRFLKSTPARVLTAILLVQMGGLLAVSRRETVPLTRPLSEFPSQLGAWTLAQEGQVDQETMEVLKADDVLTAYDSVMSNLAAQGPSPAALHRIRAKMQSDWYSNMEAPIDRASLLSHAMLLDGTPESVNQVPDELARVTPEEVRAFAAKYLVKTHRTIINRVPAPSPGHGDSGEKGGR